MARRIHVPPFMRRAISGLRSERPGRSPIAHPHVGGCRSPWLIRMPQAARLEDRARRSSYRTGRQAAQLIRGKELLWQKRGS